MQTESEVKINTLHNLETIFRENYSSLFRYVHTMVKDEDEAKDVLSDMFLNLWMQKDNLQITNIKAYLFRAARNGALKTLTARQTDELTENCWNISEQAFSPFERLVAKESVKIVERLINKLPAMRKEIIQLRLTGLKNHEIAKVLDATEKKIEYHMREAIEQLGYYMRHENYDRATIAGGLLLVNVMLTFI